MNTLLSKFREFENQNTGFIPTLSKAIRFSKCTENDVIKVFKKVENKEEYERKEKDGILKHLFSQIKKKTS